MIHKCEYCDKEITACIIPCEFKANKNHVCCTCPSESCELPEKVVCDGPVCTMKLQIELYKSDLDSVTSDANELKESISDRLIQVAKLKELDNHFRILGFSPSSLETLIQNFGLNLPGLFINQDERFTWDQITPEDKATLGLNFIAEYERRSKQWAGWLNEKVTKIVIQKSQLTSTQENIKKAQKTRDTPSKNLTKANGLRKHPKVNETVGKNAPLNHFEKLVRARMKTFGWSQPEAEQSLRLMGMKGEARDLKAAGLV